MPAYLLVIIMVGLGGLDSPTAPFISIEAPGLGVSFFAIPDAVRLDNPKLMLWRELQQHGNEALQKSNKRWLVWDLERKTTIPGWDFGGYAWTFAKSKSNVINTRSSLRQHSESTESLAPEVSRRRPYPLRNPPHEGSTRILLEDSRRL